MAELDIGRKVRQLDNDVHAIYEILEHISDTQKKHGAVLRTTDLKLDGLAARADTTDLKLDGLAVQADGTDVKVDRLGTKLDRVLDRLGLAAAQDDD